MKKFLLLFLLPVAAYGLPTELREYGVATTVDFCLADYDSPSDLEVSASFVAGDVLVQKDEGVPTNIGTLPTDEGNCYSVPLTAAEMQAARIQIQFVDQSATKVWMDDYLNIITIGDSSAELEDVGNMDALILATGTADSGTTTTLVDAALTEGDDYWNGAELIMTGGSASGQSRCVVDFVASSDTIYVAPAFTAAVSTDTYVLKPNAACRR